MQSQYFDSLMRSDTIFCLFIMTKINSYLQNKSWMLLSPMTSIGSYSNNKLLMPLSPFHRNYPNIIINNGPNSATSVDVEESTVYKAMPQSTLAFIKHKYAYRMLLGMNKQI